MKKLGTILVRSLAVLVVAFIVFRIGFNLVENLRLVTGGTVTQGIILSVGSCNGGRYTPSRPMYVQFTDTQGRQQVATAEDGCGYIGIPFRQAGDHVSIVYLSNTPTLARIQSDLILQFWVLEVPFLLIALLIVLLTLRWLLRRSRTS